MSQYEISELLKEVGKIKEFQAFTTENGVTVFLNDDFFLEINLKDLIKIKCIGCQDFDKQEELRELKLGGEKKDVS